MLSQHSAPMGSETLREMDLVLERNTYLTQVLILSCLFSHILEEKYSKTKINYDQS